MTAFLAVVFSFAQLSDRLKNAIALFLGIGLSLAYLPYKGLPWTFVNIFDYSLYGFIQGAAAVGLWKTINIQVRNQ
jgi:hypothetical protein